MACCTPIHVNAACCFPGLGRMSGTFSALAQLKAESRQVSRADLSANQAVAGVVLLGHVQEEGRSRGCCNRKSGPEGTRETKQFSKMGRSHVQGRCSPSQADSVPFRRSDRSWDLDIHRLQRSHLEQRTTAACGPVPTLTRWILEPQSGQSSSISKDSKATLGFAFTACLDMYSPSSKNYRG